MMIKYIIKTVDGNRYEYTDPDENNPTVFDETFWVMVKDGPVTRMFFKTNIVSITKKSIENDS